MVPSDKTLAVLAYRQGRRKKVLYHWHLAGVVSTHLCGGRVEVERPVAAVGIGADLVVEVDLAAHVTQTLEDN